MQRELLILPAVLGIPSVWMGIYALISLTDSLRVVYTLLGLSELTDNGH